MKADKIKERELLKAAVAMAVADGKLCRSEMGVVEGLAAKCGVGRRSLDVMIARAAKGDNTVDRLVFRTKDAAHEAFELLVAQAHIDGEVSREEEDILARVANRLGITGDRFGIRGDEFRSLFQRGVNRANAIRRSRQRIGGKQRH
ncbi:MAG: tellurite resistance TerB family protein [Planctomycetota bacterium]|jgi:tellurite resistance protein